ncbi:DUF2752 domain-containing protein [Maribacter chungangensis]|uniref:DUF2752 domain-containing protein n=1 Tax=Maribacter chungangensis TaxID=1069117 RepID=A0ABW3B6C5_9FLAO
MQRIILSFFLGIESFMLPCFTKQLWGFDCPGCGMQRAIVFLLKGDFGAAFQMYPAIYPMLLLFGFLIMDKLVSIRYANKITNALMISTVGFILTNYILKFI